MTNEAYLQRKWFGGRDTEHLTFTEAVELTMQKKYEWVGLTDDEIKAIVDLHTVDNQGYDIWCDGRGVADDVEAKLKEKNA